MLLLVVYFQYAVSVFKKLKSKFNSLYSPEIFVISLQTNNLYVEEPTILRI
ncbi:hypothetical protein J2799_001860 [Chryseobacterium vietnamense]|nr:hypothetical protein [Chryseobacterium vietnamense]